MHMADRRSFIKKSAALTALAMASGPGMKAREYSTAPAPSRILPKRLEEGDLIGLVTPGSSVTEEQLAACISKLED